MIGSLEGALSTESDATVYDVLYLLNLTVTIQVSEMKNDMVERTRNLHPPGAKFVSCHTRMKNPTSLRISPGSYYFKVGDEANGNTKKFQKV